MKPLKLQFMPARIKFAPGQQQTLSGTLGGLVYRTYKNGIVTVHSEPEPFIPHKPTKEQVAKYRKDCVVQDCVRLIQTELLNRTDRSVAEMQRVADMHHLIKTAMLRWYDYYRPHFKDDRKLTSAIIYYFKSKKMPLELALKLDLPST